MGLRSNGAAVASPRRPCPPHLADLLELRAQIEHHESVTSPLVRAVEEGERKPRTRRRAPPSKPVFAPHPNRTRVPVSPYATWLFSHPNRTRGRHSTTAKRPSPSPRSGRPLPCFVGVFLVRAGRVRRGWMDRASAAAHGARRGTGGAKRAGGSATTRTAGTRPRGANRCGEARGARRRVLLGWCAGERWTRDRGAPARDR
jgi:hypothetical protein